MKIGLDLDGCVYQWDKTARFMLRNILPDSPYKEDPALKRESQYWDYIKAVVDPEHWEWLWTEGIRLGLFRYGHLYPQAVQSIRDLAEEHEIVLITHRPRAAITDTLAWLGLLNLPLSGLHLLTNQEPKSRVQPQCDVYLDDKVDNILDLHRNTKAKMVCLMGQPWNKEYAGWSNRIERVHNWPQFIQVIKEIK